MTPISLPGELADVLFNVYESAPVQTALLDAVTSGEVALKTIVDTAINNLKGNGFTGVVIAAGKGAVETEVNNALTLYTPAQIVAFVTREAQLEVKAVGG